MAYPRAYRGSDRECARTDKADPSQLFRQREYQSDVALPPMSGCMVLRIITERRGVNRNGRRRDKKNKGRRKNR